MCPEGCIARMRRGEDARLDVGRVECQEEWGNLGVGEQNVQSGVETVAGDQCAAVGGKQEVEDGVEGQRCIVEFGQGRGDGCGGAGAVTGDIADVVVEAVLGHLKWGCGFNRVCSIAGGGGDVTVSLHL